MKFDNFPKQGVDIGGLDLTLHCGFPTSRASLLQQAGRAGRGKQRLDVPSLAVVVCFNSPPDQHLWRHPSSLLHPNSTIPVSMPIYPGLLQEHLLCAGREFPLTGNLRVTDIVQTTSTYQQGCEAQHQPPHILCDADLFGSRDMYQDAMGTLWSKGSLLEETVFIVSPGNDKQRVKVFKTHPSIAKPHMSVSLRSIESVNYNIVNADHPGQGGRMDGTIYDDEAIMDVIPYSRVFYHAFPGAIITHRGRRYKIASMTRPPAFANSVVGSIRRSNMTLAAFAKPTTHRYFTRPLSNLTITVIKQMERVDLTGKGEASELPSQTELQGLPTAVSDVAIPCPFDNDITFMDDPSLGSLAGCGMITVKRNVYGYQKLSMVNGQELSRSELSLPDLEFDTFAIWLDCDAELLKPFLGPFNFGYGVHALSHALVAVAPLFVPCTMSDIQCDHAVYKPTRVVIFDERAGGSGICSHLWKSVFVPNGLVERAIQLLEGCPSCSGDAGYQGGCPACLQFGECIKFNDFLCKSSGLIIAKHLLHRLKQTDLYQTAVLRQEQERAVAVGSMGGNGTDDSDRSASTGLCRSPGCKSSLATSASHDHHYKSSTIAPASPPTPKRSARKRALQNAKDMAKARDRQLVVGRPTWPGDESSGHSTSGKLVQEKA
jgi:DEAD/DEAH box helicase domain-containing protein